MDLSIVVVTYRSKEHILACLRSLAAGVRPRSAEAVAPEWECVVMDNDSGDGTPELVEREAPWARLVRTGANLGYAKAVNRGFAETSGAFVRVLNPDCLWREGGFPERTACLREHLRCGIALRRT